MQMVVRCALAGAFALTSAAAFAQAMEERLAVEEPLVIEEPAAAAEERVVVRAPVVVQEPAVIVEPPVVYGGPIGDEDAVAIAMANGVVEVEDVDKRFWDGNFEVDGTDASGRDLEVTIDADSGVVLEIDD